MKILTKTEELFKIALEMVSENDQSAYLCLMDSGEILSSPISIPESKIEIDMNSFRHHTVSYAELTQEEWAEIEEKDNEFQLKAKALLEDGYYYELAREEEEKI